MQATAKTVKNSKKDRLDAIFSQVFFRIGLTGADQTVGQLHK
jgi:hypothetical protein